jgi:hypothetical protein
MCFVLGIAETPADVVRHRRARAHDALQDRGVERAHEPPWFGIRIRVGNGIGSGDLVPDALRRMACCWRGNGYAARATAHCNSPTDGDSAKAPRARGVASHVAVTTRVEDDSGKGALARPELAQRMHVSLHYQPHSEGDLRVTSVPAGDRPTCRCLGDKSLFEAKLVAQSIDTSNRYPGMGESRPGRNF